MKRSLYGLIDCNNFFASCERVFRPDLQRKPVAVLSNNDGCFVARSNEVKALGIPMGAPLFKFKDIVRAHNVTLFSANFELYGDISQRIVSILREETPLVEVYSIDECFIDLSDLPITDINDWAHRLSARILREVGVPVSVGIAPTKTLAKVATTYAKTHGDGVYVVDSDEHRREMLAQLPVQDVWGVGWRIGPRLLDKGISTALQLIDLPDAWLHREFNITGIKMVEELRGQARLQFGDKSEQRKTIMRSRSFGHRISAYHQIESAIATFAAQAAYRLRTQNSVCRGIIVFMSTGARTEDPRRVSKLVKLDESTADTARLITAALTGLQEIHDEGFAYQKAGVTLVDIASVEAWQLSLIAGDEGREERQKLMQAMDGLNSRFGSGTVWHASEARAHADWHSKRDLRSPRYTTRLNELPVLKA
jgi:DNA polymerase V